MVKKSQVLSNETNLINYAKKKSLSLQFNHGRLIQSNLYTS